MLTEKELSVFKSNLSKRKIQIEKNLNGTAKVMKELRGLELNDEGDYAAASAETVVDSAILEQQSNELTEIELALGKINEKTYGICEMCEEPIGKLRLEVKNFARFCITCRSINEKEEK